MSKAPFSDYQNETMNAFRNIADSDLRFALINLNDEIIFANDLMKAELEALNLKIDPQLPVSIFDLLQSSDHKAYLKLKQELDDRTYVPHVSMPISGLAGATSKMALTVSLCKVRNHEGESQYFRMLLEEREPVPAQESPAYLSQIPFHFLNEVDAYGIVTRSEYGGKARLVLPKIVGRNITDVFHANAEAIRRIRRAMNGERFDVEIFVDGFWYHTWYEPLFDSEGNPTGGAHWISFPIDRQKRTELALKKALLREHEATRLREDLIAIASHDLRSPLSSLSMQIQLLESYMNSENDSQKIAFVNQLLVTNGKQQIQHIVDLIDKTLDVSRIDEQGLALDISECDIVAIINAVVQTVRHRKKDFDVEINVNTPDRFFGKWDAFRIEQVIENLLTNAIKYGLKKPIDILIRPLPDFNKVMVEIKDRGIGVAPADQEKIFDRFVRVKEQKSVIGYGMGLYIVKQIVAAHGGDVSIQSESGQGSTFAVTLPIDSSTTSKVDLDKKSQ